MYIRPQLLSINYLTLKEQTNSSRIKSLMAFRPVGEDDFIYIENPSKKIVRVSNLIEPISYPRISKKDFNCHGTTNHVLEGTPLQYLEYMAPKGHEMSIEEACNKFESPFGFQVLNRKKVIHSGIVLGIKNEKYYIFHKLGPYDTQVSELSDGLYYYPNHTHLTFYESSNEE